MKIKSIRCHIVGEQRNFFFVVVETDNGLIGVGEGGVTWREQAMAGFVEALKPSLIEQDPRRIEHLWQLMFRGGFFPANRIGAAAISAIDIALWDIKAQALGIPVYELFGGRVRDRVVCYPHAVGEDVDSLVTHAQQLVRDGWQFIRFNMPPENGNQFEPGPKVQECIDRFAALRKAVGPDIELIVDVHTRLDPPQAITLCRALEPWRPFFIEDPLRSENPTSLRKLVQRIGVPIAMGEQYATKWEFRPIIEEELTDYARIDVCIVGGLTEARKVAGWCETHYIPIAPHNPLGPVSTAACLHLDLATSNFAVQECARIPGEVLPELFPRQVPFANGYMLPPDVPGLGVEIDESQVHRYPPIAGGDCPRLARNDGTFTNW